jgi:hypothetical protein
MHIEHSHPTQHKYHQAITSKKHAASAHRLWEELKKRAAKKAADFSSEEEMKPPKCRPFTAEKTEEIACFFDSFLKKHNSRKSVLPGIHRH